MVAEKNVPAMHPNNSDDEIVISGISGKYPNSRNIGELSDNLYKNVYMIDKCNIRVDHICPKRKGQISDIEKFDAKFFGMDEKLANVLNPTCRMLLELTIEACLDAGINPNTLRGTNTGIFIGLCGSENVYEWYFNKFDTKGLGMLGNMNHMYQHYLSYIFDLNGPSEHVDAACSSTAVAVNIAATALQSGICDRAIIGGSTLLLNPLISYQFAQLGSTSLDGVSRPFDHNASGFVRSEAVCVAVLEKQKTAKRKYATVIYTKLNADGYKSEGISHPTSSTQIKLMTEFYDGINCDPININYIEAHGTGTIVGDPIECQAIADVFRKSVTDKPLLIGSVKSNIGHAEGCAAMCSISKIVLTFENDLIPANVNFEQNNKNIPELSNNVLRVCNTNSKLIGSYAAMNSFGIGGANGHALFKKNSKEKQNYGIPTDNLPRLVNLCGQIGDSINEMIQGIESGPLDSEFIGLIHSIYSSTNDNFTQCNFRGYGIYQQNALSGKTICLVKEWRKFIDYRRPIALILNGIDEWLQIGLGFIDIEPYRRSLCRSHEFLLNYGFNLYKTLLKVNSEQQSNLLKSYRTILLVSCQIAFIDMLKDIAVPVDFYVATDAIGDLTYEYTKNTEKYEDILSSAYPYYDKLEDEELIGQGKYTCVTTASLKWMKNVKQNYEKLSPKLLPKNTIVIEISKHSFKMSNKDSNNLYLLVDGKGSTFDALLNFLNILGKLFISGIQMNIAKLYPQITFPVSRNTKMISPLVRWDHEKDYYVSNIRNNLVGGRAIGSRKFIISLNDMDYKIFEQHVIDGRVLLPATGYLMLVWETFSMLLNKLFLLTSVEFNNVKLQRATVFNQTKSVTLYVFIHLGSGEFEICEGSTSIVMGKIKKLKDVNCCIVDDEVAPNGECLDDTECILNENDFYKNLRIRGYDYGENFHSILWADYKRKCGQIKWQQNWITFMDGLLQIGIITKDVKSMMLPTTINKLSINVAKHIDIVDKCPDKHSPFVKYEFNANRNTVTAGGVELTQPEITTVSRRKIFKNPILEVHKFIPNFSKNIISQYDAIQIIIQMFMESSQLFHIKIVEVEGDLSEPLIIEFENVIQDIPLLTSELTLLSDCFDISSDSLMVENNTIDNFNDCDVIILKNFLCESDNYKNIRENMNENGYIVSVEDDEQTECPDGFQVISIMRLRNMILHVLQLQKYFTITRPESVITVSEKDKELNWLEKVKTEIAIGPVIILSENEAISGIIGLVNCLRKEQKQNKIICMFIDDLNATMFNPVHPFYKKQLDLCLPFNIYRNGKWGTYRHVQLLQDIVLMPQKTHCFVNITEPGDLSKLSWYSGPLTEFNKNDEKIVVVQFGAINFRDVLLATGRLNIDVFNSNRLTSNYILGYEFAGINKYGKKIMGICGHGGMGSHVIPIDNLSWEVPDDWSLKDAATCSIIYATVYYSFFRFKPIAKGKTILIHAGSGGVGLAAIRVALCYGMKVFTTVSNAEKRKFLLDAYPELKDNQIGNSRDCSFLKMIKQETNYKGVDYVLNSLSDEKLLASICCLARGGVFLEIGRVDLMNDKNLKLTLFRRNVQFCPIMLDKIFTSSPEERYFIHKLIANDIKCGIIQPIFNKECNVNELQNVFRFMGTAKHIGKIVLKIRDLPTDEYTVPLEVIPCVYFDPKSVYIIPGGLGGFGLELVDWMIIRGARKFVLNSRNGITQSYQSFCISNWKNYGVQIVINQNNIATRNGCEKLILEGKTIGDIGGIFNLAVVLQDALLENQSVEKFMAVLRPKSLATKYLDELTRKLCPTLKHFVVFSSLSCGRGNAGQTNYGMANSIMERIVEQRILDGLPGKAIQWGAIGDVGVVAEMTKGKTNIEIGGTALQPISSCLSILDKLLTVPDAVVASMIVTEKRKMISNQSAFDLALCAIGIQDVSKVSLNATLSEVGMDSIVATEIRAICQREVDVILNTSELASLTLNDLKTILQGGSSS